MSFDRQKLHFLFVICCYREKNVDFFSYFLIKVFAIKDKHGRHVKGSDKQVKEVVDYVVFERHLTNKYGKWRVCGKLFPQPLRQKPSSELLLTGKNAPAV